MGHRSLETGTRTCLTRPGVPDSHLNSYVRFKLALTEVEPTIKPYDEAAWAELSDGRGEDAEGSLLLLEAVHRRWTHLLRSLDVKDYARTFRHPESGLVTLECNLQLYAWHGRHHLAHVGLVRGRPDAPAIVGATGVQRMA
jgi:hypothetical protein